MDPNDDFVGPKRALLDEDQEDFLASNTRPAATVLRKAPPQFKGDYLQGPVQSKSSASPAPRAQVKAPEPRADVVIKESTGIKQSVNSAPPKKKSAFALAREAAKATSPSSASPASSSPNAKLVSFQIKESHNGVEGADQVMIDVKEKDSDVVKVEPPKFQTVPFPEVHHRLLSMPPKPSSLEKEEPSSKDLPPITSEKEQIDRENRDRVSTMTQGEIDDAQKEIFSNLSPALIEKLRSRGKAKLSSDSTPIEAEKSPKANTEKALIKAPVKEKPSKAEAAEMEKFDPLEWAKEVQVPTRKHTQPFKDTEKLKYYRFDFNGKLLSFEESVAISPAKGLHHHGEEPALAGYNISELIHLARSSFTGQAVISLQALTNIIKNCKRSPQEFAYGDAVLIFEYLCESDFPMTLRLLLDSNKPNLLIAAIDCLHALISDEATSAALKLLDNRLVSVGIFPLSSLSSSKLFHGEFEVDETGAEDEGLSDVDVFKEDVIVGFIFTDLLPRIRYILEMVNLPLQHSKLLDILIRFSIHSIEACVHLVECPHFLSALSAKYLKVSIPDFSEDTAKALELFRRIASGAPSLLPKLSEFDLPERLKVFLLPVLSKRSYTSAVELKLIEESFRLMGVFASSQQHLSTFIDLFTEFATIIPNSSKSPQSSRTTVAFTKFLLALMKDCVLKENPSVDASHIAPFIQQLIQYFESLPRAQLDLSNSSHAEIVACAFELFSIYFSHVTTRADKPAAVSSVVDRLQPVLDYLLHSHLFQHQLLYFMQGKPVESKSADFVLVDRSNPLFSGLDVKNLPSYSLHSFLVKEVKNTFFEKSSVVFTEDEEYLNSDRFSEKLALLKASFFGSPYLMAGLAEVDKFPPRINSVSHTLFSEPNFKVLSNLNDLMASTNHFVQVLSTLYSKTPTPTDFARISAFWSTSLRVFIDIVRNGLGNASKNLLSNPLLSLLDSIVDALLASLRTYLRLKYSHLLSGKTIEPQPPSSSSEIFAALDLLLASLSFLPPGRELELTETLSIIGILFDEVAQLSSGRTVGFPLNFFRFVFVEMAEDERLRRIEGRKLKRKRKGSPNELNLIVEDSQFLPRDESKLSIPYDWIFSLFHKQLEDEEEQVPGLDEVLQGLELILLLHRSNSKYYLSIPIEARCLHFLHLFLFPSDSFRDDKFQALAQDLLRLLGEEIRGLKGLEVKVDLEKILGGNLVNFVNTFSDIFIHQSYGNQLFAQTLQFFMQKGIPPEYEEALWASLENTWSLLAFKGFTLLPLQSLLISPATFDSPLRSFEDEFDKVVKAMIKCFSSRLIYDRTSEEKLRGSFVYWYLIHHISTSLNSPPSKENIKEKKLTRRSVLNLILKQESIVFSEWEKKLFWSDIEKAVPDFAFHDLKDYRPLPLSALSSLNEDSWVAHHHGA